jgi:peptidoglycan/xylan/chitin deacetylase (PgdA/CDA1 family)
VFFRNDDVAAPGKAFASLMELFSQLHVPLNLAVVPAWLTSNRWQSIKPSGSSTDEPWCWHQHGWRHANHEISGKKEFGPGRDVADLESDIVRGRHRLENLMGESFFPVFTPPWNRCDKRTLQLLKKHGFVAVSRSQNPKNSTLKGLADFCVNVDLHTRKDRNFASGWRNLLAEFQKGITAGLCGIMIHHNLMNTAAFEYLEILLKMITARKELHVVHFRDLARIKKGSRFKV